MFGRRPTPTSVPSSGRKGHIRRCPPCLTTNEPEPAPVDNTTSRQSQILHTKTVEGMFQDVETRGMISAPDTRKDTGKSVQGNFHRRGEKSFWRKRRDAQRMYCYRFSQQARHGLVPRRSRSV